MATDLEIANRIYTIQCWIIDGVHDTLIKKQAVSQWSNNGKPISFKTVDRYIKKAYENWKQNKEISIEDKRAAKIAELQQRKRTMEARFKNTPEGIRTLNDIDKMIIRLEAMEPPKQVVVQGDIEKPLQVVWHEVKKYDKE